MKSQINLLIRGLLFVLLLFSFSCLSVPKAAPDLSLELGIQIRRLEVAHKNLLRKFFDEKRRRVDEFIQTVWIPEYANQFFGSESITSVLDQVIALKDNEKEYKKGLFNFVTIVGPELLAQVESQRMLMIAPLDSLEQMIQDRLTVDYNQALTINNTITGFLSSSSKVEANREKYLQVLGINTNKIDGFINKAEDTVNGLLVKGIDSEKKVSGFLNSIRSIKNDFSSGKDIPSLPASPTN